MRVFCILPALLLALPMTATAQDQGAIDRVVGARLLVSEFIRICVRTDADPERVEDIALRETWLPDAPSTIKTGLTREPDSDSTIYSFNRTRPTASGRVRSQMQVIVPEPGVRDCTVEFELVEFADAKQALESSGYSQEKDDPFVPAEAPIRVQRTKLCQPETTYRKGECAELAVDPAAYPLTGQMTLVRVVRERPVLDGPGSPPPPLEIDDPLDGQN